MKNPNLSRTPHHVSQADGKLFSRDVIRCHSGRKRVLPGTLVSFLTQNVSMKKHAIKIFQIAYFELKRISSVRRFLTEDAFKTLVTSYILSRLDYCNCLLMGTPNSVI